MSTIRILSGSYRKQAVVNTEFTLVKGYQTGAKGGYVTVKNDGQFAINIPEVKVLVDSINDIEFLNGEKVVANTVEFKKEAVKETETEAMDRIAARFEVLDEMSRAAINGDIRAMIVTGPAGIGKSHGVNLQMEKASMFDRLASKMLR